MPRTVRDVMTKLVLVAPLDAGYTELVRLMHDWRVSALPIVDADGGIAGIVSEADLLRKGDHDLFEWHLLEGPRRRAERRKAVARTAKDLMTSPAIVLRSTATPSEAARLMREKRLKHVPVTDDRGRVLGMISRVDLLTVFLRGDEAIRDDVLELCARHGAGGGAVTVEVADGVVRLEGSVVLRSERERLVEQAQVTDGVVGVDTEGLQFLVDDAMYPVGPMPWGV